MCFYKENKQITINTETDESQLFNLYINEATDCSISPQLLAHVAEHLQNGQKVAVNPQMAIVWIIYC